MRPLFAALAVLLLPLAARADMLPDGHKGVELSVRVEAQVPSGKALVLANTFEGGTLIVPGTDQKISWHPLGGEMQLRLVGAGEGDAIKAAGADLDRDKIKKLLAAGVECAPPFAGVRTIVDTSPAEQVRWTYRATIDGNKCSAELVKQEYLDATGKAVPAPSPSGPPKPIGAPLADPPKPADAPAPAPTPPPAPAPAPVKAADPPAAKAEESATGCDAGGAAPGGLAGLALVWLLRRRRR
ncbi:Myxococcales GC_trans_RRR domain-containing protein [Nannocystis exedens]|uniref:Myxococcales GC_trans_RRR domain-containing protein n=1 Tax=Nannocystis exedens TaxID=54 RepID=A0A1I2GMV7_9BACT|nr:MYXO-CTERM sorting domain-containing protein [Nannocystis exedens]SFF17941.1 Myxococcales GC_trans_RRR domain-containing protein [Nannocystis exedens]